MATSTKTTFNTLPIDIHFDILSHLTAAVPPHPRFHKLIPPVWSTLSNHPYLSLSLVSRATTDIVESYCRHLTAVTAVAPANHRKAFLLQAVSKCYFCSAEAEACGTVMPTAACCGSCDVLLWPEKVELGMAMDRYGVCKNELTAECDGGAVVGRWGAGMEWMFDEKRVRRYVERVYGDGWRREEERRKRWRAVLVAVVR